MRGFQQRSSPRLPPRPVAGSQLWTARGQASVELVGGLAGLFVLAFAGLQLLAIGYGAVMADHAAEAAALALANGKPADQAAHAAVPGWPRNALRVRSAFNRVEVTLIPPSPLSFLRGRLAVTGEAAVRQRSRGGSTASRIGH